jgi:HTH-type transcriptional regulator/antitoxin HigA
MKIAKSKLCSIRSPAEYDAAVAMLEQLVMRDEDSLDAGEADYLEVLESLVEAYDDEHYPMPASDATPLDVLKFLVEQAGMSTSDLGKVLGSKGIASEILNGKREMSKAHIFKLAERFNVEPALFLEKPRKGR